MPLRHPHLHGPMGKRPVAARSVCPGNRPLTANTWFANNLPNDIDNRRFAPARPGTAIYATTKTALSASSIVASLRQFRQAKR